SHVMHIVSNVEGRLSSKRDSIDALAAGFPAGTVSGAPKVRAMEIIDELEKEKRGLYAGAVGYFSAAGDMDTAIVLRTALIKDGTMYVQAGAGIVADSDPKAEQQESVKKAKALFRAAEEAKRFASDARRGQGDRRSHDRAEMEKRWRAGDPRRFTRAAHRADAGHGPQGRDQSCARGRSETLGRHRRDPPERKNRRASSWCARERDLRGAGQGAHALGRAARIHRRGRSRRLHLRAALRAASGDQRQHRRAPRLPAGAQRQRGRRGPSRRRDRP